MNQPLPPTATVHLHRLDRVAMLTRPSAASSGDARGSSARPQAAATRTRTRRHSARRAGRADGAGPAREPDGHERVPRPMRAPGRGRAAAPLSPRPTARRDRRAGDERRDASSRQPPAGAAVALDAAVAPMSRTARYASASSTSPTAPVDRLTCGSPERDPLFIEPVSRQVEYLHPFDRGRSTQRSSESRSLRCRQDRDGGYRLLRKWSRSARTASCTTAPATYELLPPT